MIFRENVLFFYKYNDVLFFSFDSCKGKKQREETSKSLFEWIEKEIIFPGDISCYVSEIDMNPGLCDEIFQKEFKILLYVDSAGCSSCRLKLMEWKQLIEEAEILYPGRVGFLFFFQPKSEKEMTDLLSINGFDYPVFMDTNGSIDSLNQFPQATQYRLSQAQQAMLNTCFLLDKDNKVVATGNPTITPRTWESYKYEIEAGDKTFAKMSTSNWKRALIMIAFFPFFPTKKRSQVGTT